MADLMFREGTYDENIWKSVFDFDEYRLGAHRFLASDVVLDIGAHIGSFSYTCLDRGAGRCVCVEPDPDNFLYLRHNLHAACRATDRAILIAAAAWRSDQRAGVLGYTAVGANTGGGNTLKEQGMPVAALPFDALVRLAGTFHREGLIRLVKLDCEGAEWPILLTSQKLYRVQAIVGEYHTIADLEDWPAARMEDRRYCDRGTLETLLARAGFTVWLGEEREGLGIFKAWRDGAQI